MLAAALLLASAPAAGPGVAAKAFVDGIYARWDRELKRGNWRYQPPRDRTIFAPELAALFAKDARIVARTGDMGAIDAVPLCSCQDDEGMRAVAIVLRADARAAMVRVRLTFGGGTPTPLTLRLVRLPAGWRIADITDEGGSMVRRLHLALDRQRG